MSKFIALDVGEKRVGVAVSDDLGMMAMPFCTLSRTETIPKIIEMVENDSPDVIVVGQPFLPSGGLGSQAEDVAKFVAELGAATSTKIVYENEVLTSREAENRLKMIKKGKIVKGEIDAMAACIILESYMNRSNFEQ